MKICYWYAEHKHDPAYSIREKTYGQCLQLVRMRGGDDYKRIRKITLEISSTFELLRECMSENAGWWEREE